MRNEIKVSGNVFTREQTLLGLLANNGDYIKVKMKNNNEEVIEGVFIRTDSHIYFWTNDGRWDGDGITRARSNGYRYSWVLSCRHYTDALVTISMDCDGWSDDFTNGECFSIAPLEGEFKPLDKSMEFFHKNYLCESIYKGIQGYHSGRCYNALAEGHKPSDYRIGVELEVECNSRAIKNNIHARLRSNWLLMERDGSLSDNGIEFITIPMRPADIKNSKTWSNFIGFMSDKAKSWNTSTCGLHVHIGREILGDTAEEKSETLGKLLYLYHHWLKDHDTNIKIYGRARAYHDQDGKVREGDAVKVLGSKVLKVKGVKDDLKAKLTERSLRDRYFDINNRNSLTIEFRKGRGSLNTDRIISVIEYSELMCLYCRKAKWDKISDTDFFEFVRKKIKRTSPLHRFVTSEEMDS